MPLPHAPRARTLAGRALSAFGALGLLGVLAAGACAETFRVPDQP